MSIHLDNIYSPSFFSATQSNFMGKFSCHTVKNIQILFKYLRYNELTLAGSILGINLTLITLSEKIFVYACNFFQIDFLQSWAHQPTSLMFKSLFTGSGLYLINDCLDLQLDHTSLVISMIVSLSINIFWQKACSYDMDHAGLENEKVEIKHIEAESDPDELTSELSKEKSEEFPISDNNEINPQSELEDVLLSNSLTSEPLGEEILDDEMDIQEIHTLQEIKVEDNEMEKERIYYSGHQSLLQSIVFNQVLDALKKFD